MLILSRREAECICLGENIVVTVVSVSADKVRIGNSGSPRCAHFARRVGETTCASDDQADRPAHNQPGAVHSPGCLGC